MRTLTVTQLNRIIKDMIDNELILEDITVTGELSSFSITRGVAYFTLKDNDNIISCIQFGCKQEFSIGDLVECRGNVKYYPKGGKLSFNALNISLCGQGALYQEFLLLKEKLEKEGLFDNTHKIPIPKYIKSIGVVTSATGAVIQDIKNVVTRRNPNLDIYVYDAQVQGKMAVNDVIHGITYFDNMTDVDVIIVARGGGSIEDLMPFNNEELARVAFICNKPIISAVGHETDFSILDFVSDLRAPTPSAAAELVTFDRFELKNTIRGLVTNFGHILDAMYQDISNQLTITINQINNNVVDFVNETKLIILDYVSLFDSKCMELVNSYNLKLNLAINTLDQLNPIKLLQNGYSSVTIDGKVISSDNTNVGDDVRIRTYDTNFVATIKNKEKIC